LVQLHQWTCTGNPNQQFDVHHVGGDKYEVHVVSSGKCVDLDAAITSNGNEIQQYTCDNSNRQRWYFRDAGDGSFIVESAVDRTKVWDVAAAATTAGAQLQIYASHGGANQRFWLEPAVRTTNIADGVYTLTNVNSGKCIDVPSSNTTPGVQLQQYTCNGTNAQNFRVTQDSSGFYTLVNVNSGLGLQIRDFSPANDAAVEQQDPHGGTNQLFSLVPWGAGYTIRPAHSYGCVDVDGASTFNGAKIQQYLCNNTNAQVFKLSGSANVAPTTGPVANTYPVVLVHGFMGFGRDELFGLKYWGGGFGSGGTRDIQEMLRARGVQTFTASVGPLSSARDRAVELFYQIKGGCVDYGQYHSTHLERLDGTPDSRTLVRVLDGGLNSDGTRRPRKCWATDPANNPHGDPIALYPEWGETPANKIHLIGHSFGSATNRVLLELLRNGDPNELDADPSLLDESVQANPYRGNKNWVSSLTSVAGTQDGASLAAALESLFPVITNVIGGVSVISGLLGIDDVVYDLDLQQFGIERSPGESIWDYIERVRTSAVFGANPTRNSAAYDLTPEGMNELNAS
ncbi:MAG: RICIN domain-containing protein, partial [Polyangiaceae bacterium]|nr:RICIN domain-containing protein [Polyangiaceae bacterium]